MAGYDFETEFADALADVPDEHLDEGLFVPGFGPLDAAVALVGEAPGEKEVERGAPFVGPAGRRLDDALAGADLDRDELYVTNVVKVRPPENRDPLVGEIDAWRTVLEAELDRVAPDVVVTLGNVPTRELLETDEGITDLRGRPVERRGRTVVPTFHPAATFYDESKQDAIVGDLRTAVDETR